MKRVRGEKKEGPGKEKETFRNTLVNRDWPFSPERTGEGEGGGRHFIKIAINIGKEFRSLIKKRRKGEKRMAVMNARRSLPGRSSSGLSCAIHRIGRDLNGSLLLTSEEKTKDVTPHPHPATLPLERECLLRWGCAMVFLQPSRLTWSNFPRVINEDAMQMATITE